MNEKPESRCEPQLGKRAKRRLARSVSKASKCGTAKDVGNQSSTASLVKSEKGRVLRGRLLCTVAYDGTDFEGFQTQPHGRATVQDAIERRLTNLFFPLKRSGDKHVSDQQPRSSLNRDDDNGSNSSSSSSSSSGGRGSRWLNLLPS